MIEVKNISKKFNNNVVLNGIDLNINKGDVVAIIGPSRNRKVNILTLPEQVREAGKRKHQHRRPERRSGTQ